MSHLAEPDTGAADGPDLAAPAKSATSFRNLLRRLKPGDIAVVDIPDMDAWTAEQLLAAGVAGLVNVSESITGRSPAAAVSILLDEGIPVLDKAGRDILEELQQGELLTLSGNVASLRGGVRAEGLRLTPELARYRLQAAREYLAAAMAKMADAVAVKSSTEWVSLLGSARVPYLEYVLRGKLAAVILDGPEALAELRGLRLTLSRAVIIATGKSRPLLGRVSNRPDIMVGHDDELSDSDLLAAPEVVLLQRPGEHSAGVERCQRLGVHPHELDWPGPPEEAALSVAADAGARSVLQVGGAYSFSELARRREAASAAAILTRLRLGPRVIDAAAVKRLHPGIEIPTWAYVGLGVIALGLIVLLGRAVFG